MQTMQQVVETAEPENVSGPVRALPESVLEPGAKNPFKERPAPGYGYIYLIRTPSGRGYVGQTIQSLGCRIAHHLKPGSGCTVLRRALAKYDRDSLGVSLVAEVPVGLLDSEEERHIRILGTRAPAGYNLTSGGGGVRGYRISDEARRNMSLAQRALGKRLSPEHKALLIAAARRPKSEKHRAAISQALMGRKLAPEHLRKLRERAKTGPNPFLGRSHSEETRKIISEKARARKPRPKGPASQYVLRKLNEGFRRYVESGGPKRDATPEKLAKLREGYQRYCKRKAATRKELEII